MSTITIGLFSEVALAPMPENRKRQTRLTISGVPRNEELLIDAVKTGIRPNYQLLYSLGRASYLNCFSPRAAISEMNGLYIPSNCTQISSSPTVPYFLSFYRKYCLAGAKPSLLTISYAGVVQIGYLADLQTSDYTRDGIEGFSFILQFLGEVQGLFAAAASVAPAASTSAWVTAQADAATAVPLVSDVPTPVAVDTVVADTLAAFAGPAYAALAGVAVAAAQADITGNAP